MSADGRPKPGLSIILRSAVFAIGQALLTVIFALLGVSLFAFPYRLRYRVITLWTRLNLVWLRATCHLDFVFEGLEHVPAKPAVVLCKHQSAWETLALQLIFDPQAWVMKRELLLVPFFGWGLAMLRPIAINRRAGQNAIAQVKEQGRQRLEDGIWVVIFPEGTRVIPGTSRRYKPGGGALAEHAGVPVVPVAHNAGVFWPRNSFLKYPGTIRLVVGPVIHPEGLNASQITSLAEAWIERTASRLHLQAGTPC